MCCGPTHSATVTTAQRQQSRRRQWRPAGSGQRALDDDLLHVARAFVYLAHTHVAVDALHREVVHHAVAAQRLDGGAAHALGHFAGKQLGHGGLLQARAACVAQPGGVPDELARGFDLRGAVGQAKAHGLVVEDGGAKALALLRIRQRRIKRAARHAHALRGNADAPAFERAQGDLVALALGADEVLGRDAAVVEVDLRRVAAVLAQLVFQPRHHIAGVVGGHEEGAHALLARALVGHGDDDGHMAVLATGDELLDAVDHIFVALLDGGGAQCGGVGTHMRLGQAKRTQHFAARQRREPVALLLCIAIAHEDGVDGAVGHADGRAGATITGGDFFQHQRQRHVVQVGTAELFGHADAVGTQCSQALVRLFGEVVFLVPARLWRPRPPRATKLRFPPRRGAAPAKGGRTTCSCVPRPQQPSATPSSIGSQTSETLPLDSSHTPPTARIAPLAMRPARRGSEVVNRATLSRTFCSVAAPSKLAGWRRCAASTAGRMALTSPGRWPGSWVPSCTTLMVAETAPQLLCPSTRMSGTCRTSIAYSMLASASSFRKLPASRTTNRSPGPWSKASSGAMRESAQIRMAAKGRCPVVRATRPTEKSRCVERPAT